MEDCFLVKVHAPAIEALEAVLDRFLLYQQTGRASGLQTSSADLGCEPRAVPGARARLTAW